MTKIANVLLALGIIVGLSIEQFFTVPEINIDKVFLSYETSHNKVVNDPQKKYLARGETTTIEDYSPPLLYVEISGKKLSNKVGYV